MLAFQVSRAPREVAYRADHLSEQRQVERETGPALRELREPTVLAGSPGRYGYAVLEAQASLTCSSS